MPKSQSLHPDILFHFTSKESLFSILRETFSLSYSSEKIVGKNKSTAFAVPMVSFCDLKLSELKLHMGNYGNYGIGLTKEWANREGLNPVFYTSKFSPFTTHFIKSIEGVYHFTKDSMNLSNQIDIHYMGCLLYTSPSPRDS